MKPLCSLIHGGEFFLSKQMQNKPQWTRNGTYTYDKL